MNTRDAFALITVLAVSSILMLFTLACWQRAMLCYDLVALREQFQERFYLTEMALNAGLQVIQQNPDVLTRSRMPVEFSVQLPQEKLRLGSWIPSTPYGYAEAGKSRMTRLTAGIVLSVPRARAKKRAPGTLRQAPSRRPRRAMADRQGERVSMSAQLRESGTITMVLRCTVTEYKRENNGQKDTQNKRFALIVDNFTIGTAV